MSYTIFEALPGFAVQPGAGFVVPLTPITAITLSGSTVKDSAPIGTVIGTAAAVAALPPISLTWSLGAGSPFAIDPLAGTLTVNAVLSAGNIPVVISGAQEGKAAFAQGFVVHVALEVAPTSIVFTPAGLSDLAPIGTLVGTATATDTSAVYAWSLATNPGGRYHIDPASGAVTLLDAPVAGTDMLGIQVADGIKTFSQTFAVPIAAPMITAISLSRSSAYTSLTVGGAIAQASVTGSNLGPVSYAIPAGQDGGGMLAISPGGTLRAGLVPLVAGTLALQITATPSGGTAVTSLFTITVSAVAAGFRILAYQITAETSGVMGLSGVYDAAGVPPSEPGASWSSGELASVSGWTAAAGRWSCAVTTPASATGALTLSIGGVTSGVITVVAAPFDLPPGLYFPSTVFYGPGFNAYVPVGSFLLRGFVGTPVVSLSGPDSASYYINNSQQVCNRTTGGVWANSSGTSFHYTITATDGILTSSVAVTCLNPATAPTLTLSGNVLLDSAGLYWNGIGYAICGVNFGNGSTSLVVTDPAGVVKWDAANSILYVPPSSRAAYGAYPITLTLNGSTSYNTIIWIAHQRPPSLSWQPLINVYDNTPALTQIGTVSYSDDTVLDTGQRGQMTLTVPTNPAPGAYIGWTGNVSIVATPSAGDHAFVFAVQGQGGTTLLSVLLPVAVGTTLAASNITYTALPALDNAMAHLGLSDGSAAAPVLITSLSVSGFINTPTWRIVVQTSAGLPDVVQGTGSLSYADQAPPRYTFNGPIYPGFFPSPAVIASMAQVTMSGRTAALWASYLSAQTDHVTLIADDGLGTICTVMIPVVVTAKIGPVLDVGPGQTYATVNAVLAAWWANRAAFNGATLILHPGIVAATDINFSATHTASGYLNGWWPGPVTLKSPSTVRTVLDWAGDTNGSQQAGIVSNNFDMTLIDLEVCRVTDAGGSGSPNAGGVYMTGTLPGNLTMRGCYVYSCDMGLMNGDGAGRHVLVDQCNFQRNGAADGAGTDHNMYISTVSSFTCSSTQSDCSMDDHDIKSRARVTNIINCSFRQGAQSIGSGSPIDTPLGGLVTISGNTIMASSNPGNPISLESGAEGSPNSPIWPGSATVISNNTFLCLTTPAAYDGGNSPMVGIAVYCTVCPTDGSPFPTTYSNNQFYNLPKSLWCTTQSISFPSYYGGTTNPAIDGGGNVALTTYPPQTVIDPLTGVAPIHAPAVGLHNAATNNFASPALMDPNSLRLDYVMPSAPALGAVACRLTPYDANGNPFTGITYTMQNNAGGAFTFGPAGGPPGGAIQTATANTPDGLYFVQASASGQGVNTGQSAAGAMSLNPQWIPIIVGSGFVAAVS